MSVDIPSREELAAAWSTIKGYLEEHVWHEALGYEYPPGKKHVGEGSQCPACLWIDKQEGEMEVAAGRPERKYSHFEGCELRMAMDTLNRLEDPAAQG